MKLHFEAETVRQLLAHTQSALTHNATFEQMYDAACRKDGRAVDPDGDTLPIAADVDVSKVPAGLWLVGDQGVYLMTNGPPPLLVDPAGSRHVVAYAHEANPERDGWWSAKRAAFGGDDGVVFLDPAFVTAMLTVAYRGRIAVDLTPERVAVAIPAR